MTPSTIGKQIEELKEMLTALIQERPRDCDTSAELAELTDKIAEITKVQAVIIEQLKVVADTNKKVADTVYGNGKPGLVTIVSQTRKDVDGFLSVAKAALLSLLGLGITALFYLVLSHGIINP
jgi:hypothetical protein